MKHTGCRKPHVDGAWSTTLCSWKKRHHRWFLSNTCPSHVEHMKFAPRLHAEYMGCTVVTWLSAKWKVVGSVPSYLTAPGLSSYVNPIKLEQEWESVWMGHCYLKNRIWKLMNEFGGSWLRKNHHHGNKVWGGEAPPCPVVSMICANFMSFCETRL